MVKRIDTVVYNLAYEAVMGTLTGGLVKYGLAEEGLDYEINEDLLVLLPSVINIAEMIRTGIINGTFSVPEIDYLGFE